MVMYADQKHPEIEYHLDRAGAQTIVATTSVLAGFICFERSARIVDEIGLVTTDYVFYVYVAQPFRRHGCALGMFEAAGVDPGSRFLFAYRTQASFGLRDKVPRAHYSPMYARYSPEENDIYARDHIREADRRKARRRRA